MKKKTKICFVLLSRANYGSAKALMEEVKANKFFEIQIVVGASAVVKKFGQIDKLLKKDGFKINEILDFQNTNLTLNSMSKTVGFGLISISEAISKLKPDYVLTVGDRYETISTALASIHLNIPLIHTMGGERTGTLDESIRHSVSKLAHLHFVANNDAKQRLIKMGENKKYVYNVGCPRIDTVKKTIKNYSRSNLKKMINTTGVGAILYDLENIVILSQHSVTSEFESTKNNYSSTFEAVKEISKKYKVLVFWPNADPGSDQISSFIRSYREKFELKNFRFISNLPSENYFQLMNEAKLIVGNSSSAIREGSFIGIPAINVGTRQQSRIMSKNVINVGYNKSDILKAISKQIKNGKFKSDFSYGRGDASKKILNIIKKIKKLNIQKLNAY